MRVSKEIDFGAAHKLLNYAGKCSNLHGHTWTAIFTFEVDVNSLDQSGISVDFSQLKKILEEIVPDHADANMWILSHLASCYGESPSAENIALVLARRAIDIALTVGGALAFYSVRLYESKTSFVEVFFEDVKYN